MSIILPAALAQLITNQSTDFQNLAYELYALIAAASGDVVGPGVAVNNNIAVFNGTTGKLIKDGGSTIAQVTAAAVAASGNVVGPASAVDGNICLFDTTSGKLIKDGGAPPSSGLLQSSTINLTGGNITTASNAMVDLTGATITITTGAHRCLVFFNLVCSNSLVTGNLQFDLLIDGVSQGGTSGIALVGGNAGGGDNWSVTPTFLTSVLTAASHEFKLQWRVDSGTGTVRASAVAPLRMSVIETGLTV